MAEHIQDAVLLMWVFSYKFNEDGYLCKYKACLVIQGDLQEQYGYTYVATLAAHLFQALMAVACAFNLRLGNTMYQTHYSTLI
jgi:hypothetical protein